MSVYKTSDMTDHRGTYILRKRKCPLCAATYDTLEAPASHIDGVAAENYRMRCAEVAAGLDMTPTQTPMLGTQDTYSQSDDEGEGVAVGEGDLPVPDKVAEQKADAILEAILSDPKEG